MLDFKQEDLEKIADAANNNPLAIRLTIDLYLKGGDVRSSITKSQKDIASFSYKNLIESLRTNSITILEAIYAVGAPTKTDLSDFLNLSKEELAESLNELTKTSLIIRYTDEYGNDTYRLSDSIRDLLLTNPKNIEVRNSITENLKKRKAKILEQSTRIKQLGLTEFDDDFIPNETEPNIYGLITDLNKLLSKNNNQNIIQEIIPLKDKFSELLRYKNSDWLLLFNYSRIFKALKDTTNELVYLRKAEELNKESAKIKLAIALQYFYNNDYQDAKSYFEALIDKDYHKPQKSSNKFSFSVIKLYYLCLLYLGEYDEVIDVSSNWKELEYWGWVVGVSRATALKRTVEYKNIHIDVSEKRIDEILSIFNYIFDTENYNNATCIEANKIIKGIEFIVDSNLNYSNELIQKYMHFVSKHFFNMISKLRNENINTKENQEFISKLYSIEIIDNPLKEVKWYKAFEDNEIKYDKEHIEELIEDGYDIVKVYHIPEDKGYGISSFMFAENNEKKQFYLYVNCLDEGWNRWGYIKEGDSLAIKYKESDVPNKPHPATEIVEIDEY